ncbi:hypothetical protein KR222_008925, partial [Zaprionus bogoriensis]
NVKLKIGLYSQIKMGELRQAPNNFTEELRIEKFCLEHHAYQDFHRSQWQTGPTSVSYLAYRWVMAIIFGSGLCTELIRSFKSGRWFIYLTNWGFLMCSVTSISGAIFVTIYHFDQDKLTNHTYLIKFYWACFWTTLIVAHAVCLVFWVCIYPTDPKRDEDDAFIYYTFNTWTHVLPLLGFNVDHLVVAHPSRLLHFIYPVGFGLIYLGFSYIYHLRGGHDPFGRPFIYSMLNFAKPRVALASIGLVTSILMISSVLQYGVYRLRVFVARKLGRL